MPKRTTAQLKAEILSTRDFDGDSAGMDLLEAAMRARDTETACLEIIKKEGWMVRGDRGQSKAHPLAATARDARAQYFQGLKLLGLLDVDSEKKGVGSPSAYDRWHKQPKASRGRADTTPEPATKFAGLVGGGKK